MSNRNRIIDTICKEAAPKILQIRTLFSKSIFPPWASTSPNTKTTEKGIRPKLFSAENQFSPSRVGNLCIFFGPFSPRSQHQTIFSKAESSTLENFSRIRLSFWAFKVWAKKFGSFFNLAKFEICLSRYQKNEESEKKSRKRLSSFAGRKCENPRSPSLNSRKQTKNTKKICAL